MMISKVLLSLAVAPVASVLLRGGSEDHCRCVDWVNQSSFTNYSAAKTMENVSAGGDCKPATEKLKMVLFGNTYTQFSVSRESEPERVVPGFIETELLPGFPGMFGPSAETETVVYLDARTEMNATQQKLVHQTFSARGLLNDPQVSYRLKARDGFKRLAMEGLVDTVPPKATKVLYLRSDPRYHPACSPKRILCTGEEKCAIEEMFSTLSAEEEKVEKDEEIADLQTSLFRASQLAPAQLDQLARLAKGKKNLNQR